MTSTDIDTASAAPHDGDAGPDHHDHSHDEAADGLTVTTESLEGSQVSLTVEVAATLVDSAVEHATRHLARRVRLPGFRPGKAPSAFVQRAVGWPAVTRETLDEFVPRWYSHALHTGGVDAVGDPEVTLGDLEAGAPFRFTATVMVRPDPDLGDYLSIRVEQTTTEITEEQVDAAIEEIRTRKGELVERDRPAQAGDVLKARLVMNRDGQAIGASDEVRDVELNRERLLAGLADGLIGLSAGESHSIQVTLPDDYPQDDLRNAAVVVDAHVIAVRERVLPPLDDSLAVLDEHGETLEELRAFHRERLEEEASREDEARFEAAVLDRFSETATVEIPSIMVDREVERQIREMEMRLAQMGLRLDKYLELSGETLESTRENGRETAEKRVRAELVLEKLAAEEGLEVDESDVEREEALLASQAKLTAEQRRVAHRAAHRNLLLQGAAQRALAIARGE